MSYHTVVTPIDVRIFPIGEKDRQLAYARIFRYTSIAYLKKIEEHFVVFAEAYELFVKKTGFNKDRRLAMEGFFGYLDKLQSGLKKILSGDVTGYIECLESSDLTDFINDRQFEDRYVFREIGYRSLPRQSIALFRLAEKLMDMFQFFGTNVGGYGGFKPNRPMSLSEVPYLIGQLTPLPSPQAKPLPMNTPVPVSGIYLAIHEFGYPSYYAQGMWTQEARVPRNLTEVYQSYSDFKNNVPPIDTSSSVKKVPVEWVLIWKDDRYRNGKIPDESEFIDETCELPTYSLAPPPLTEDD